MLTLRQQPKYLKKKVQLPNGNWALVVFELQGNTWKAVYGEIIGAKISRSEILALPAYFEAQHITPIVSPFFAEVKELVKDLAFVVTQPTRAPGF
jgi:hypothetical protein